MKFFISTCLAFALMIAGYFMASVIDSFHVIKVSKTVYFIIGWFSSIGWMIIYDIALKDNNFFTHHKQSNMKRQNGPGDEELDEFDPED